MKYFQNRILVVVDDINENNSSGARVNLAMIKNLSLYFSLTVVHANDASSEINGVSYIKVYENQNNVNYLLSRIFRVIRRVFKINLSPYFENLFGFSFTFFSIVDGFRYVLNKLKSTDYNLVITLSEGESFIPHYVLLGFKNFHNSWLAYIHDPYPMAYYPASYSFEGPGTDKKIRFMRDVLTYAKYVSFPGIMLAKWMQEKYDIKLENSIIIPHQIDIHNYDFEDFQGPELFKDDKFIILHAGNILDQRNPMALINAFSLFLKQYPHRENSVGLHFIGNIGENHFFMNENNVKDNVCFHPKLDYRASKYLMQKASVNVILESNDEISPFLPGKITDCLMMKNPILLLTPRVSELGLLFGEEYSFRAKPDNVEAIFECIDSLYSNWIDQKNIFYNNDKLIRFMGHENLYTSISLIFDKAVIENQQIQT